MSFQFFVKYESSLDSVVNGCYPVRQLYLRFKRFIALMRYNVIQSATLAMMPTMMMHSMTMVGAYLLE